jgi:hypothetical protein
VDCEISTEKFFNIRNITWLPDEVLKLKGLTVWRMFRQLDIG